MASPGSSDAPRQRNGDRATLVDEAQSSPHRISKCDTGCAPRQCRPVEHAVGGEGVGSVGQALIAPATIRRTVATALLRISGIELCRHEAEDFAWQPRLE